MTTLDETDHARGARVEIAIRAAQDGDLATAAGVLAGMSAEERDTFGPLVAAAFPGRRRPLRGPDLFGTEALRRIGNASESESVELDVPEWVNAR